MKEFVKRFYKDIPIRKFFSLKIKHFRKRCKAFLSCSEYQSLSFSQEGEDMILMRTFENQKDGFYVDVGAHHPFRFSNTCILNKRGWRGINIDATPGSMYLFQRYRKKDINIEKAISDTKEELKYYIFNEPALNTFSKTQRDKILQIKKYKLKEEMTLTTCTLNEILDIYLPGNQEIDLLSVDAEGWDMKVLRSINLNKYQPKVIVIEALSSDNINELSNDKMAKHLSSFNYQPFAKTVHSAFFKKCQTESTS